MLADPLENVYDERIQKMVINQSYKVKGLPMEVTDIQQDLCEALIVYFNETPNVEKRTLGAVRNVIVRKLYRLIRAHTQFEGCCEATKKIRRNINSPASLHTYTRDDDNTGQSDTIMSNILLDGRQELYSDQLATEELLTVFLDGLNDRERTIFDVMLDGINTPRGICKALNFSMDTKTRKKLSKEITDLRTKFKQVLQDG